MAIETRPFDPSEYLDSDEGIQAYLEDAFASGDPSEITDALGVVAKAVGMSELARRTGLTRPALYKALTREGNPEFATIVKVAEALGLKLSHAGRGLGSDLLSDALRRIALASQSIGIGAVLVQAKDEAARLFYLRRAEFEEYPAESRTLYLPIETVVAAFS